MKEIYVIDHITKEFPGVKALDNISFSIHEGEIHALVGENGAGKSTLMNILSGFYEPTSGNITFDGQPACFSNPADAQKLGIAMVHQELSLSATLSIAENIYQNRLPKGKLGLINRKKLVEDSRVLMERVGLSHIDPNTRLSDINVSQQQQVEIAKALSLNAKFLIFDEPTSALTTNETKILMDIMRKLKSQGITMLYISHKLEEILEISDRITVFRDGCYIDTVETHETNINQIISFMVGREYCGGYVRDRYMHNSEYAHAKPVLEIADLSTEDKLKSICFTLYQGEVLGLTGLVGSGRSELLQAIFGADPKTSGEIIIDGKNVKIKNTEIAIKNGLGLVPEGRKTQGLFLKFCVKKNMTIVRLNNKLKKLELIKKREEEADANEYKQKLRVKTPSLEQRICNLSGGNQQKTIVARWLMNHPKILFLDEPTQGIDVGAKNEIYDIINELAKQGVSLVVVSSEMPEIIRLCDRILVMHEGRIVGEVKHDEVNEHVLMTYMSGQGAC